MRTVMYSYFAFGSNLDTDQMHRRCPEARALGSAVLANHELAFHGYSARWGGSVATIRRCAGGRVQGLIYLLSADNLAALDGYEGVGAMIYERVTRYALCADGHRRRVQTYMLRRSRPKLPMAPNCVYLTQIWSAYMKLGFDRAPLWRALQGTR